MLGSVWRHPGYANSLIFVWIASGLTGAAFAAIKSLRRMILGRTGKIVVGLFRQRRNASVSWDDGGRSNVRLAS